VLARQNDARFLQSLHRTRIMGWEINGGLERSKLQDLIDGPQSQTGIRGIIAGIDSMDMPWYLYIAFFGYLGTYILYPIWTIWLGRNLLLK